jgi:hypothetical protein
MRAEHQGLEARAPLQGLADDVDVAGAVAVAAVCSPNVEVEEDLLLKPPWLGQEAAGREAATLGAAPAQRPT